MKIRLALLILFIINTSYSQKPSDQTDYYNWFDEIVGSENIGIFDGIRFKQKYRTQEGEYQFYHSSKFIKGNIVYDDQPYYDVEMKYDVYKDEIVVNLPVQSGYSSFQLNSKKINRFYLNDRQFINLSDHDQSPDQITGFYELFFQDNTVTLYKRYLKIRKEYYYKNEVYSKFNSKNEYLLFINNSFHQVGSKKDFIKLYPAKRKEINTYYKSNKRLLNSNYDLFMMQLMQNIGSISYQNLSGS